MLRSSFLHLQPVTPVTIIEKKTVFTRTLYARRNKILGRNETQFLQLDCWKVGTFYVVRNNFSGDFRIKI